MDDDSYPYLLTTDWNYGDRAHRIVEMVEADVSIDLAPLQVRQRELEGLQHSYVRIEFTVGTRLPLGHALLRRGSRTRRNRALSGAVKSHCID